MIRRILIANRGEIARRIAVTARRLGIQAVVPWDPKEALGYELRSVISDLWLCPDLGRRHFLDIAEMVRAARESGCDAIHPGFGFLSEKAEFAEATLAAGLTWIGPRPRAIAALGSKASARRVASQVGVAVTEAHGGLNQRSGPEQLEAAAAFGRRVGYPLLAKAVYGGGGKGMRIIHREDDLASGIAAAAAEAAAAFGHDEVLLEQYISNPRHVEVQILGDPKGKVYILGDRDCSVQRRHQKVIEEAPAPNLPPDLRQRLHEGARKIAEAAGYDSAGTAEFMVPLDPAGQPDGRAFFLELNTRLQVEHTVTEEVWGVDLIDLQIRAASGGRIDLDHAGALAPRGHAIQARIYSEDPEQGFFPVAGDVRAFLPCQGPGLRWEVGASGTFGLSSEFDPMLAKAIAYGADRTTAIQRLDHALRCTFFCGPASNISFVREVLVHPAFAQSTLGVSWVESLRSDLISRIHKRRQGLLSAAETLAHSLRRKALRPAPGGMSPRSIAHEIQEQAFRIPSAAAPSHRISSGAGSAGATITRDELRATLTWYDPRTAATTTVFTSHGSGDACYVADHCPQSGPREIIIQLEGETFVFPWDEQGDATLEGATAASATTGATRNNDDRVVSPVPGKIVRVEVKDGAQVEAGQLLFVLESMKMQYEIRAPRPGAVTDLKAEPGKQVRAGEPLTRLKGVDG